jgi:hypothetical protein
MMEEKRKRGRPRKVVEQPKEIVVTNVEEEEEFRPGPPVVEQTKKRYRLTGYKSCPDDKTKIEPDIVEEYECDSPSDATRLACRKYGIIWHPSVENMTPRKRGRHG